MKYNVDENVSKRYGLTIDEVYMLSIIKMDNGDIDKTTRSLVEKNLITEENDLLTTYYSITPLANRKLERVLIESDDTIPSIEECVNLAKKLMEIYPKGSKRMEDGGSYSWRGNSVEIAKRLQKFFKMYGKRWNDEAIIEATKRYVQKESGSRYMKILKYFIYKNKIEHDNDGKGEVEVVSELATTLENPEFTEEWVNMLR